MPNVSELMEGLTSFQVGQTQSNKALGKNEYMMVVKMTRNTYKQMFLSLNIQDWNKPIEQSYDPELGVKNPYSKISCFVVHLYSMDLGTPPLYSVANRVARDMDLTLLR